MSVLKKSSAESRRFHFRGRERINARVSVVIEWQDGEKLLRAEGHTVDVSYKGCLLVLHRDLALEQRVRVINRATDLSAEAVIVWKGHKRPDGWEIGIEILNPTAGFWGLEL